MKETTRALLHQITHAHDWDDGQVYGGRGLQLSCTDVCRVCGLVRHWHDDRQHGPRNQYTFTHGETGEPLTVRQAAALSCCEVTS